MLRFVNDAGLNDSIPPLRKGLS